MSHGDDSSWVDVAEGPQLNLAEELAAAGAVRIAVWRRLVRSLHRIRRLQRIWGLLGQFLQSFPKGLRDQLLDKYPKQWD